MANFSVQMDTSNTDRLLKELAQVQKLEAKVGVDAGAVEHNGTPTSEIALYLEYGWVQRVTAKQTGFFWGHGLNVRNTLNMPARPTFGYTAKRNHDKWEKLGAKVLGSSEFVLKPLATAIRALNTVCLVAQSDVQETITTNGHSSFAPRAPLTIAMYSAPYWSSASGEVHNKRNASAKNASMSTKALVYKGDFLRSITYEIKGA